MYTREQASQVRQQFWTSFGRYMAPILSAQGQKINWINYKTGIRHLYFKMDADKRQATLAICILHKEKEYALALYQLFVQLKPEFEQQVASNFTWQASTENEHGQQQSCIFINLQPVNIFKQEDWPQIISFFKTHLLALDGFWADHKMIFETIV